MVMKRKHFAINGGIALTKHGTMEKHGTMK
jgi:hypothetical protein